METKSAQADPGVGIEFVLRGQLAQGDTMLGTISPILRHLLSNCEHSVFSDEIVAKVRGMARDVAMQLLGARAEGVQSPDRPEHRADLLVALQEGLIAHHGLLAHIHALAMEWQLTERLQTRLALDPVISPLLQALIASFETAVATKAMSLLAAQARFAQNQRRMELPLAELPGDLLHAALLILRTVSGDGPEAHDYTAKAEELIRARFDEARSRAGLIASLLTGMGGGASAALSVSHAGVAIFVSALGMASGQSRDLAILSTSEAQLPRLILALRAAGIKPEMVEAQFAALHPALSMPRDLGELRPDRAAAILAQSSAIAGA